VDALKVGLGDLVDAVDAQLETLLEAPLPQALPLSLARGPDSTTAGGGGLLYGL
jgi:hypothetical protein